MKFSVAMSSLGIGQILSLVGLAIILSILAYRSLKGHEVRRQLIFAVIWLAVSVPIIVPITFYHKITPVVESVFDKVESLPPGSKVLISFDFDPAMAPEILPMANALTRHCLAKGHKVVFITIWATGASILASTLDNMVRPEFPNLKEHVDWANIGYKAGNQGVLNVIVTDLKKMYPTDVNGVLLDSIPLLKDIKSCKDFDLILALGGGLPGPKEWVLYVGDPGNIPIGVGAAAVTAPQLYPYYPKQLLGLLGGIKGAAEYEQHLSEVYPRFANTDRPAVRMMGPQTLAHVVVMIFIVIGNVIYFRGRKSGGAR